MHKLIPRFSPGQASARLEEIRADLAAGKRPGELVRFDSVEAVPNATGGVAANIEDLQRWRKGVMHALDRLETGSKFDNDTYGIELGKALDSEITPSPSDAAADGVWSFLSLGMFPDVVYRRWPGESPTFELSKDRWIGGQVGRDRNYLKLSWRRWRVLGEVMEHASPKLGEDEFGALLERSAVARNRRLVRIAAQEVISFSGRDGARSEFARALMKQVTYRSGPLNLDILTTRELVDLVSHCAEAVLSRGAPRRAVAGSPSP